MRRNDRDKDGQPVYYVYLNKSVVHLAGLYYSTRQRRQERNCFAAATNAVISSLPHGSVRRNKGKGSYKGKQIHDIQKE